jgi:hypothetical protein
MVLPHLSQSHIEGQQTELADTSSRDDSPHGNTIEVETLPSQLRNHDRDGL